MVFKTTNVGAARVEPAQTVAVQPPALAIQPDRRLPERPPLNGKPEKAPHLTVAELAAAHKVDRNPPPRRRARVAYVVIARVRRANKDGGEAAVFAPLI